MTRGTKVSWQTRLRGTSEKAEVSPVLGSLMVAVILGPWRRPQVEVKVKFSPSQETVPS